MGGGASSTAKIAKKISMRNIIGRGSFATVKSAIYTHSRNSRIELAVKVVCIKHCISRKGGIRILEGEILALKRLNYHPHVCNLHFAYHDNSNCYMVMDLLEGGDLRYHINHSLKFTEKGIAFIAACISSALNHIHSHGIIHRDVKPENIVFDCHGYPRLIDFGIAHNSATCGGSMVCTQSSGTLCYLAPEVLTPTKQHSIESDFWSLGVVLYELMFLRRPFSKHCPRSAIGFVLERYSALWDSTRYNILRCSSILYKEITVAVAVYDSVDPLCDDDFLFEVNPLPDRLRVKLPPLTAYGSKVSSDFTTLVQGLLDPRVPQRLGAGVNFTTLRSHPFFNVLDVSWDELLEKNYSSPIDVSEFSLSFYSEENFWAESNRLYLLKFNEMTDINIEVSQVLEHYSFNRPVYLSGKHFKENVSVFQQN